MIHSHFSFFDSSQALSMLSCSLLLFVLVTLQLPLRCHLLLGIMNKLFSILCPVPSLTIEFRNLHHDIGLFQKQNLIPLILSLSSTYLLSFQSIVYMEPSLRIPCKTTFHNFCVCDKSLDPCCPFCLLSE